MFFPCLIWDRLPVGRTVHRHSVVGIEPRDPVGAISILEDTVSFLHRKTVAWHLTELVNEWCVPARNQMN